MMSFSDAFRFISVETRQFQATGVSLTETQLLAQQTADKVFLHFHFAKSQKQLRKQSGILLRGDVTTLSQWEMIYDTFDPL